MKKTTHITASSVVFVALFWKHDSLAFISSVCFVFGFWSDIRLLKQDTQGVSFSIAFALFLRWRFSDNMFRFPRKMKFVLFKWDFREKLLVCRVHFYGSWKNVLIENWDWIMYKSKTRSIYIGSLHNILSYYSIH